MHAHRSTAISSPLHPVLNPSQANTHLPLKTFTIGLRARVTVYG